MHSFCTPCLESYIESRPLIPSDAGGHDICCPTCRQQSAWSLEKDLGEQSQTNLLLTLQATTRKYKCLFCPETQLKSDLKKHVEVCAHRKCMCDQGCSRILHRHEMHTSTRECLALIESESHVLKRQVQRNEVTIKKKNEDLRRLSEKLETTQARIKNLEELIQVNASQSETGGGGEDDTLAHGKRKRKPIQRASL